MSKAILVFAMPEGCHECPLIWKDEYSIFCPVPHDENKTDIYDYISEHMKPWWCPLKEAPMEQLIWYDDERSDWERGYNNCLREIVGEQKE